ncbi:MAG: S-layer homology domain-containing protein [Actinomycetota bacterium]|nr:S-layer homology domain-containing protein [Actinomycetota bacterium]
MLSRSKHLGLLLIGFAASLLLVVGVALANGLPPGGTFTDDDGNVHEGNIEAIAAEGITKGCNPPTNDLYCPDSSVTRGQMAAFVRRAFSLPSSSTNYFVDDDDSVFEGDINAVAAAGITKGCNPPTNDRFCPDGNVTREQMAAFLRRAFDYPAASADYFTDDGVSIFEADINAIAEAGVTKGCNPPTNDRYCPRDLVKRDQMASFFSRALGLTPITPPPPTTTVPLKTFGDGTWIVGRDISAGTYRTAASKGLCYGARLAGFSGDLDDIIANEIGGESLIVTIKSSDAGFESSRCHVWTNDMTPRTGTPTSGFADGYWLVGDEVAPGLWRNSGSADTCYWERLSGFSWEFEDLITNGLSTSVQTVRIRASDVGFHATRCGSWTYLGP